MDDVATAAANLARRHETPADPDPVESLLNVAERPRTAGWTLRSALVRVAQPHPVSVSAVLTVLRRCEAVLHPLAGALAARTVTCDRAITVDALTAGDPPADPTADTRVVDLARLLATGDPRATDVVTAVLDADPPTNEERTALALLGPVVELDHIGDLVADWAPTAPAPPPVTEIDAAARAISARLDELGVPHDTPWPPGRGRQRAG